MGGDDVETQRCRESEREVARQTETALPSTANTKPQWAPSHPFIVTKHPLRCPGFGFEDGAQGR